jgi:hypothetical protein
MFGGPEKKLYPAHPQKIMRGITTVFSTLLAFFAGGVPHQ